MTPLITPAMKVGNGIQNKTPFLGQQVQPKLQNPVRMDNNAVQNGSQKAFVPLRCRKVSQILSDICFQTGGFVAEQLHLPSSFEAR